MMTGILWDLDGTLLDTLADLADALNFALAQFGYPACTTEMVRNYLGNGARRLVELAVPEGAQNADEVLMLYQRHYHANCQNKTKPYPGIPEALGQLEGKYPMAVVSNKPDGAVKKLCAQYFPGLYARGESADCPRKPAPDMVLKAMADIGVEKCVYVGDSEVDVLTARNAGVPCLSVLWGFRDRPEIVDAGGRYFCESADQLMEKLEEIINGQ